MIFLLLALIGLIITLFIPCLIVAFWKKRPVLAFIVATIVMWLTLAAPGIIKTIQAIMIYGNQNSQLAAGGISESIISVMPALIICIPVLWVFQWFILRRHRRKHPKVDMDKTFS